MNGIMVGSDDNMFNPKSGLTRAELAQILKNCESYILTNVGVTKHTGFIENVGTGSILISDENGDSITVDLTGKNIESSNKQSINNRSAWYWLKDVASASSFCHCYDGGGANYDGAGFSNGYVRPRFVIAA